jgi:hypothetical protein
VKCPCCSNRRRLLTRTALSNPDRFADRTDRDAGPLAPISSGEILVGVGVRAVPFFVVVSGEVRILRLSSAADILDRRTSARGGPR